MEAEDVSPKPDPSPERNIARLIWDLGLTVSIGEARRLCAMGGIRIDGTAMTDPSVSITPRDGMLIQVGRKKQFSLGEDHASAVPVDNPDD